MLEVKSKATSKSKAALLDLVFVALFAAVMTVCAQIQIPFGEVPFTLQTLGVFIAASLLGWKRGTLSVIVYVLLGLAGVPVFAGFSGGIGVLFGPTRRIYYRLYFYSFNCRSYDRKTRQKTLG